MSEGRTNGLPNGKSDAGPRERSFALYWTAEGYKGLTVGEPLRYAAGKSFTEYGLSTGDRLYVFNILHGGLRLLGMFVLDRIVTRDEARKLFDVRWDGDEYLVARDGQGTVFDIRDVPDDVARSLRFIANRGSVGLKFRPDGKLDGQTLRSVRRLTGESVKVLDDILGIAPACPLTRDTFPIFDDNGRLVKACFQVISENAARSVILESRGGTIGTLSERNPQYVQGLQLILTRMAARGLTIVDALVESGESIRKGLSEAQRRISGISFPVALSMETDIYELAAQLRRGQREVGSPAGTTGGNTTKRLKLMLGPMSLTHDQLVALLSAGSAFPDVPVPLGPVPPDSIGDDAADFNPNGVADARRRVLTALAQRQGQPQFRRKLLDAYRYRCPVTACDLEEALEAAHIIPYVGPSTNHVQNGLLLRSDIHTLFDRGFIGIDPMTWTVRVHAHLQGTQYAFLADSPFRLPANKAAWPSEAALLRHLLATGLMTN
jgi:hypothetical protein